MEGGVLEELKKKWVEKLSLWLASGYSQVELLTKP